MREYIAIKTYKNNFAQLMTLILLKKNKHNREIATKINNLINSIY